MAESESNMVQQMLQVFRAIPPVKRVTFAVVISAVIGGFTALALWTNRPDYQVLFSNLDTADAGRIVEKLKEKRIPYQLKEGGQAILVPQENVYELRLDLASAGLPRGQNVGFEVFDNMPFGSTEFVQRIKYQQALQGELARTIMGFDSVEQARVHIVTPSENLFVEPEERSSASVVLRLHRGTTLDRRQLQGIINLVSCAVEGLRPENVTVVDMAGGLLSKGPDTEAPGNMSDSRLQYRKRLEKTLEDRIRTMLEPVVGSNRVVAKVSAELDFRQIRLSEETFDPDSSVIRSEQRQKESSKEGQPVPSGSPDLKYEVYQTQGQTSSGTEKFEKENTVINYEINRVNRQVVNTAGDVKRLSAAVIIDGPYVSEKGSDGKVTKKFAPRSRREMKKFQEIVKKAIGFDEARGDQVTVSNIPFAIQSQPVAVQETGFQWIAYLKKATRPMLNVLLFALFFFLAVRPFKRWLKQTKEYLGPKALSEGGEVPRLESPTRQGAGEQIEKEAVLDINNTEPEKIAQVIRGWLREEG